MFFRKKRVIKNNNAETMGMDYKLMVVGDGMVGKSAMCKSYVRKSPYLTYYPTISETHEVNLVIDKKLYKSVVWDTAGVEEWDKLRSLDYKNVECFILCFSVNNPTSFSNIEERWIPELRCHCPTEPILLVGMKTDIRTPANRWISSDQGEELRRKIKASGYAECSAMSNASIEGVFIQALIIAEKYRNDRLGNSKRNLCNIL